MTVARRISYLLGYVGICWDMLGYVGIEVSFPWIAGIKRKQAVIVLSLDTFGRFVWSYF